MYTVAHTFDSKDRTHEEGMNVQPSSIKDTVSEYL